MITIRDLYLYEAFKVDGEEEDPYYPEWICKECALKNSGREFKNHISTNHTGECGWCHKETSVSQPRDWKYPYYSGEEAGVTQ